MSPSYSEDLAISLFPKTLCSLSLPAQLTPGSQPRPAMLQTCGQCSHSSCLLFLWWMSVCPSFHWDNKFQNSILREKENKKRRLQAGFVTMLLGSTVIENRTLQNPPVQPKRILQCCPMTKVKIVILPCFFLDTNSLRNLYKSGKLKKAPLANHDHTVILFLKAISVIITNNNTENAYYDVQLNQHYPTRGFYSYH